MLSIIGLVLFLIVLLFVALWWWIGKIAKEDLDEQGLRTGRAWDKP